MIIPNWMEKQKNFQTTNQYHIYRCKYNMICDHSGRQNAFSIQSVWPKEPHGRVRTRWRRLGESKGPGLAITDTALDSFST